MKTVKVFIGDSEAISELYDSVSCFLNVDMICTQDVCELRASTRDYVRAISIGTSVIRKNEMSGVACVSPCGTATARIKDLSEVTKRVAMGSMPAFTGVNTEDLARVKTRLANIGINSVVKKSKVYDWQLLVRPNDYFEAVSVGAKFVDGNGIKQVYWNDVAGDIRFNVDKLARTARTELDEVLEA